MVVFRFYVFLSMCLFVLCVLCLTMLVHCLLNTFAICVGETILFPLNVIVLFFGSCCWGISWVIRVCVLCL